MCEMWDACDMWDTLRGGCLTLLCPSRLALALPPALASTLSFSGDAAAEGAREAIADGAAEPARELARLDRSDRNPCEVLF